MPITKRSQFTDNEIKQAYEKTGSLSGMAARLNITYPTAATWAHELGLTLKKQGYNKPSLKITGLQCRHAREYLGLTRDIFCTESKVSKTAIREFELGNSTLRKGNMDKVMGLFKRYRVTFNSDGTFE
mgnify:CR=1 FL=1|tara:strand:+ start:1998 stop:2381 length:384 start_codon:yes stop_codon:yes gene_type:complete